MALTSAVTSQTLCVKAYVHYTREDGRGRDRHHSLHQPARPVCLGLVPCTVRSAARVVEGWKRCRVGGRGGGGGVLVPPGERSVPSGRFAADRYQSHTLVSPLSWRGPGHAGWAWLGFPLLWPAWSSSGWVLLGLPWLAPSFVLLWFSWPCLVCPCLAVVFLALVCLSLSCCGFPCLNLSFFVLLYFALPCFVLLYFALPCFVLLGLALWAPPFISVSFLSCLQFAVLASLALLCVLIFPSLDLSFLFT